MKKFLFLIVLSASISSAFAQTTFRKKVIHKTLNVLVEEYDTKDSASTFKTGYYARYNTKYGTPSKVGSYADNQRSGIWTFYTDSMKTYFKYNYATGLILFAKPDTLAKYFLKQAEVDTTFYKDLTQVPMFVGGAVEFRDFITANLRYPSIAKESRAHSNFKRAGVGTAHIVKLRRLLSIIRAKDQQSPVLETAP